MSAVEFDQRLLNEPYALGFDPEVFDAFAAAACQSADVHPDAMEPLTLVYTTERPKKARDYLGDYRATNQTARIFVPACVAHAKSQGLDVGEVINQTTIHEIGHHLVPMFERYLMGVAGKTAMAWALGSMVTPDIAVAFNQMSVRENIDRLAFSSASALSALAALYMLRLANKMRAPRQIPHEKPAYAMEDAFASQYPIVTYTEFTPVPNLVYSEARPA